MFDIGFSELLLVAVVALVVLGPEKLPTAVRTLGLWVGRFRRTVSSIQAEITEELRLDEMRRTAAIEKEQLEKELTEMQTPYRSSEEGSEPASDAAAEASPTQSPATDTGTTPSSQTKAES